jgi:8-oxo-dGTP pyrophosphatase MutT (NUDIX family)
MALTPRHVAPDSRTIDVGLDAVRARLCRRAPEHVSGESGRRAAVSMILRRGPLDTELLLIRRAEREGDPWSGHIALPGGHHDPSDPNLLTTARRETLEEVGLDLGQHELLGALDQFAAAARARFGGLVIAPFVFALRSDAELRPNREVADLLWAPLSSMARGETAVVKELEHDGRRVRLPGFGVGDHVVWGLTHHVLEIFFSAIG